jgi:hypothetical protein
MAPPRHARGSKKRSSEQLRMAFTSGLKAGALTKIRDRLRVSPWTRPAQRSGAPAQCPASAAFPLDNRANPLENGRSGNPPHVVRGGARDSGHRAERAGWATRAALLSGFGARTGAAGAGSNAGTGGADRAQLVTAAPFRLSTGLRGPGRRGMSLLVRRPGDRHGGWSPPGRRLPCHPGHEQSRADTRTTLRRRVGRGAWRGRGGRPRSGYGRRRRGGSQRPRGRRCQVRGAGVARPGRGRWWRGRDGRPGPRRRWRG